MAHDPMWAAGLPNAVVNYLQKIGIRDREEIRKRLANGQIHWKSSRGLGKNSYLILCQWAGYTPTIAEIERYKPTAILKAINLLKKLGYKIYNKSGQGPL